MKFCCERCQTRYSIGDEKVKGKVLKIRCKTCGNIIVVREQMAQGEAVPQALAAGGGGSPAPSRPEPTQASPNPLATAPAAQSAGTASSELEWFVAIKGKQHGPARADDIGRLYREGKITERTYLWHDQLPSWTRLKDLPEFASVIAEGPAPRRPPPPPPSEDGAEIVNFEAARAQRQGQQPPQPAAPPPGPVTQDPFASIAAAPGGAVAEAPRESTRVFIMQAGLHNRSKKQRIYAGVALLVTLAFVLLCVVDYQLDIFGLKKALDAVAVSAGIKESPEEPGAEWDDSEVDPALKCRLNPNPAECEKKEKERIVAKRKQRAVKAVGGGTALSGDDLAGAFGAGGEGSGKVAHAAIDEGGMIAVGGGPSAEEIKKALGGGKAGPSGPKAHIETPSVAGTTIDAENASKVVRDGQAGIQICVDDAMKQGESIPKRATLVIAITLKGTVDLAKISEAVVNATSLGSCLAKTAKKWKFAPPTEPADLEIPLVLQ